MATQSDPIEEIDTSSYLPMEIVQEILSRLPFQSMIRFQIVSKSWNALIAQLRFSRVHIEILETSCTYFMWQSYVSAQKRREDDSDLTIDHSGYKALLPPDKHEVVWKSASMGFSIEQRTGKNCFMLGSTLLQMSEGETSTRKWKIRDHPESRFPEVAELVKTSKDLFIRGVLKIEKLSPDTFYGAYLVFRFENVEWENPFNRETSIRGNVRNRQTPVIRGDGWMEVEIGELCVTEGDNRDIEAVVLMQMEGYSMKGLIVEGIEFRPSGSQSTFTVRRKTRANAKLRISS